MVSRIQRTRQVHGASQCVRVEVDQDDGFPVVFGASRVLPAPCIGQGIVGSLAIEYGHHPNDGADPAARNRRHGGLPVANGRRRRV